MMASLRSGSCTPPHTTVVRPILSVTRLALLTVTLATRCCMRRRQHPHDADGGGQGVPGQRRRRWRRSRSGRPCGAALTWAYATPVLIHNL